MNNRNNKSDFLNNNNKNNNNNQKIKINQNNIDLSTPFRVGCKGHIYIFISFPKHLFKLSKRLFIGDNHRS